MTPIATHVTALLVGLLALSQAVSPCLAAEPRTSGETATAFARDGLKAGDWLVRGGIAGTIPTRQISSIGLIGGRIDTPPALLPDGSLSYFVTDHIAIEGQAGAVRTRPKIRDSLVGDIAVGSVWSAAAVGVVQYHFLPDAPVNPYLGVGISATWPISTEPARGIPDFKPKAQTSPLIQAGVDVHLGGNWFANAAVKYIMVPRSSYDLAGVGARVELNMVVVGGGIGYRF